MKLGKTYSSIIKAYNVTTKNIKTPEDEKIQKRVGIVKVEQDYVSGDLSDFLPLEVTDDVFYSSCSWSERTGTYSLNINDIVFPVKIVKIDRKNKDESTKFTVTFETEDLETVAGISHYVKDKENPAQVILHKHED